MTIKGMFAALGKDRRPVDANAASIVGWRDKKRKKTKRRKKRKHKR